MTIDRPQRLPVDEFATLPPELAAGLADLPAEQQASLGAAAARYAALRPAEQAVVAATAERELLAHQAAQVVEAARDALRRDRVAALLPRLAEAAASVRQGRAPGTPFAELARFIEAAAALLAGQPTQEVPAAYQAQYLAVVEALAAQPHPDQHRPPAGCVPGGQPT